MNRLRTVTLLAVAGTMCLLQTSVEAQLLRRRQQCCNDGCAVQTVAPVTCVAPVVQAAPACTTCERPSLLPILPRRRACDTCSVATVAYAAPAVSTQVVSAPIVQTAPIVEAASVIATAPVVAAAPAVASCNTCDTCNTCERPSLLPILPRRRACDTCATTTVVPVTYEQPVAQPSTTCATAPATTCDTCATDCQQPRLLGRMNPMRYVAMPFNILSNTVWR